MVFVAIVKKQYLGELADSCGNPSPAGYLHFVGGCGGPAAAAVLH